MEHASPWAAATQPQNFPALDGEHRIDVAVIGGGITGLTTALLAQRNGATVAVIEAERIASGTTGRTTGKVTSQHGAMYQQLVQRHGEHKARIYGEANEAALDLVASTVDELAIDCGLGQAAAYTYTTDRDSRSELENEVATAQRLGLPASFVTDIDLPIAIAGAVRFDDQGYVDAGRYCAGLARHIAASGGAVSEDSRVLEVEWMRDPVIVRTGWGAVAADHVIVATLLPIIDIGGFFAKARPKRSYGIAVQLDQPAPQSLAWVTALSRVTGSSTTMGAYIFLTRMQRRMSSQPFNGQTSNAAFACRCTGKTPTAKRGPST